MGNFDQYVPGAAFFFGSYPQSAGSEYKTPISWRILDRTGNNVLVISSYVLDEKVYNESKNEKATWPNSDIRKWLNNYFLNTAFTKEEQKRILYGNLTTAGVKTEDKIFLLSKTDAEKYFPSNDRRMALPTARIETDKVFCDWWLRNYVHNPLICSAKTVDEDGDITDHYIGARSGVRPAMWFSLSSVATPTKINTAVNVSNYNSVEEEKIEGIEAGDLEEEGIEAGDLEEEGIEAGDLEEEGIEAGDLEEEGIEEEAPVSNIKSTKDDNAWVEIKDGDYIHFGSYYQQNSEVKTPIEWWVQRKTSNEILLISKYVLDVQPYNNTKDDVTWRTCSLRKWLNNEFLNMAFTKEEQEKIKPVGIVTVDNDQYGTSGGNKAIDDKVCVSAALGVNKYYQTNEKRVVKPTPYAKSKGAICDPYSGTCYRWIRSPGVDQMHACVVDTLGGVNMFGEPVYADFVGVRPVIMLKLQ